MAERKWRICLDCKKAIYDLEDESCFQCGGSNFEEITKPQLQIMRAENPKSGTIIRTRHWGDIIEFPPK